MALTTKTERRNGYDFDRSGAITWVGDSHHKGTDLYYSDRLRKWVAVDLENTKVQAFSRLAAVRLVDGQDADEGLNQSAVAMDLDGDGLWLVDADWLDELEGGYVEVVFAEEAE